MIGIQKTLVERLWEIAKAVEQGKYGKDDDIDAEAFREDLGLISDAAE